jgi:hypothetical protein
LGVSQLSVFKGIAILAISTFLLAGLLLKPTAALWETSPRLAGQLNAELPTIKLFSYFYVFKTMREFQLIHLYSHSSKCTWVYGHTPFITMVLFTVFSKI